MTASPERATDEHVCRLRQATRMLAFAIADRCEENDLWGDAIALASIDAARMIVRGEVWR